MSNYDSGETGFRTSLDFFYNQRKSIIGSDVLNNEELIKKYNSAVVSRNKFLTEELLEKLFLNNLGFICKIIRKKGVKNHEIDDCISFCSIEFTKCLEKFEVEKGFTFTTFLYPYLLKGIYLFYEQFSFEFYIPRHAVAFYYKYQKTIKESPHLSFDEIFKKINEDSDLTCGRTTAYAIINALSYSSVNTMDSLSKDSQSYNSTFDSVVAPDSFATLEKDMQMEYVLKTIKSVLDERTFGILFLRYFEQYTLEEVGAVFGISRERVRQIMVNSFKKIKKVLKYEDLNF